MTTTKPRPTLPGHYEGSDEPAPQEQMTVTITADNAVTEDREGDSVKTERLAARGVAVPYLNPSLGMMELMIQRARAGTAERSEVSAPSSGRAGRRWCPSSSRASVPIRWSSR